MYKVNDDTPFAALTVGQVRNMLSDITQLHTPIASPISDIMGVNEVAELTGYSKATIYKLIHRKQIPFHKPAHGGRKVTFSRKAIEAWLQANHVNGLQITTKNNNHENII